LQDGDGIAKRASMTPAIAAVVGHDAAISRCSLSLSLTLSPRSMGVPNARAHRWQRQTSGEDTRE
jgi:hypothetical protein